MSRSTAPSTFAPGGGSLTHTMLSSRRRAIALTLGWWLLRHRLRKGGASAALGLLAGEVLSAAPRRRHRLRNLLLLAGLGAAAFVAWKRLRGDGSDDWGAWEPAPPTPAPAAASAPPAAA